MALVTVLFKINLKPANQKMQRELNWYDTIKREMLVFYGGKLAFKYQEDDYLVKMGAAERQRRGIKSTYRMLPVVEDLTVDNHFRMTKSTNKEEIEKWFYSSSYINDIFIDSISDDSIVFEVPDNEKEDFCDDLEGQGFKYE